MSTRNITELILACVATVALSACSSDVDDPWVADDDTASDEVALVSTRSLFYSVTRDRRMCPSPRCGGYYLRELNTGAPERYVSRFELPPTLFDADTTQHVLGAPDGELIVRGSLASDEITTTTPYLVVWEAFRGLPGVMVGTPDHYYQVRDRKPPIQCLVAPCNNQLALGLNTSAVTDFTGIDLERAALPMVDTAWLEDRVAQHSAVVAGRFIPGRLQAGGYEDILEIGQVFLRLPDRMGPCVPERPRTCGGNTVASFERDAERCLHFDSCVDLDGCSIPMPASCPTGYTRTSWRSAGEACLAVVCEPSFIVE